MSDVVNPADDTLTAVKNRTAGPIGTFILVWSLCHWKILFYILFDAAGSSGGPHAEAKITAISNMLVTENYSTLLFCPLGLTIVVLLLGQIVMLVWHWVVDQFRYFRERVTYKNDLRIFLHRRFGKNPDDLIATIRSEVIAAMADVSNIPRLGDHIHASTELAKLQSTVSSVNQRATDISNKMREVVKLIELADEKPLISHIQRLIEKTKS